MSSFHIYVKIIRLSRLDFLREGTIMAKVKSKYVQAIWDTTTALQDEKQMENGLSTCLSILTDFVGCENSFAWIYDDNDGRLYIVACSGKTDVTGVSIDSDQGILGYTFNRQELVIINDTENDPRFSTNLDEETGFKTKNMLAVPLKTKIGVYGCLQLINKPGGSYTEEDQMLAVNTATLSALDIEDKGYIVKMLKKKDPIISLKNIVKEFQSGENRVRVLKGIDLDIYEGEFLVILGESGCGKTTMLNIIGGMDSLTDGVIEVDGKDFSHPNDTQLTEYRRDYIGFIFQSYNLMPNLSAIENVEFVAENSKNPIKSKDAIDMVGLSDRADNFPAQMSGGQQQRVSIARALVKNPRVILADEPTAALDYQTSIEVLEIVEEIVRVQNKTVCMITHNPEIAKMADRVVKLKNGMVSSVRVNMEPAKAVELSW